MLQDRITRISEYFQSMEITNNILVIKVLYKNRWGVFPSEDETIKVCKSEEIPNEYFYYADYFTVSVEKVFDLIEETIDMNISTEKKVNLLAEKVEELKTLFSTEPLEKLETLFFDFKEVKKEKPKRRKNLKKEVKKENGEIIELECEKKFEINDLVNNEVIS